MILDKIVETKKQEVELLKKGVAGPGGEVDAPRGFMQAILQAEGVAIISEAKKASPSKGVISPDFDPVQIAIDYQEGGASCISVLTDEDYFQGSLSYIPQVRAAVDVPVLRKDFMIHELQIKEAALFGADAILLIAAILEQSQISEFQAMAAELGMDVLVEVHDEKEAESALAAGSKLIGINNRNLNDFSVDLQTTFRVMAEIPKDIPVVSESGITGRGDIVRLAQSGAAAALIGESLMRSGNRVDRVRDLCGIKLMLP